MSRMAELYAEHQQEQQEQNEAEYEMYLRTRQILEYLSDVLPEEDFSLMCYHCGYSVYDFKPKE